MSILSSFFLTFMIGYFPSFTFFSTGHNASFFKGSENVFFIHCKESYFHSVWGSHPILMKPTRVELLMANPKKAMWKLALPLMAGMSVQTIYATTDMIFVGQISPIAIAAVGFNAPLLFLVMGISFGLGVGFTSAIARNMGAKNAEGVSKTATSALQLSLILGLILTSTGLLFRTYIFSLLGATEEITPEAEKYLAVMASGAFFSVGAIMLRSMFNGEGNTVTPMIYQGLGTLINIILDPLFIYTLELGVSGAALATVFSEIFVFSALLYQGQWKQKLHATIFPYLKSLHWKEMAIAFRIGIPASLSMVIMALGGAVFNFILIRFSSNAVAGYQIGGRIDHIFFVPTMAIANALVTMVGMYYGAKRKDQMTEIILYGFKNGVFIGIALGAIFYIFARQITAIFTPDILVREIAVSYTRSIVFAFPFIVVGILSGRILQGLGMGFPSLIITSVRVVLISAPLSWVFIFILDRPMEYVWYSMITASIVASSLSLFWVKRRIYGIPESD